MPRVMFSVSTLGENAADAKPTVAMIPPAIATGRKSNWLLSALASGPRIVNFAYFSHHAAFIFTSSHTPKSPQNERWELKSKSDAIFSTGGAKGLRVCTDLNPRRQEQV